MNEFEFEVEVEVEGCEMKCYCIDIVVSSSREVLLVPYE